MKRLRVAMICDYPEEGWPSMDLTAEMTLAYLAKGHADEVDAVRICPPFQHRAGRLPLGRSPGMGRNVDRILNRFRDYPRFLRKLVRREQFDVYHVIDHSYAQLVHAVPAGRSVVTCHDLDTFRCLLNPEQEPRPLWFRAMAQHTLRGLQAASAISCDSEATRSAILDHQIVPADRLRTNYLGTHPEFTVDPGPESDVQIDRLIGPDDPRRTADLLHVGTNIPRKRIDILLATFAGVRRVVPHARLIKVGGDLTPAQAALAKDLGVADAVYVIPFLTDRKVLAALYRRASLVLQPSETEGFGLPLVEAMACGTPLLVSDIPVLREVADEAAVYRAVGDMAGWCQAALGLLKDRAERSPAWHARRAAGIARSSLFRWESHTDRLAAIYRTVCECLPV